MSLFVALFFFALISVAPLDAAAQYAPWYEPEGEIDSAPAPPPKPRPKDPPDTSVTAEVSPILHVASDPISGAASIMRLRVNYRIVSLFVGLQTPGANFVLGGDFNPFGGFELEQEFLPPDFELWLVGPRIGASLLFGETVDGIGVHTDLIGGRVTWCGPVCSYVDVRVPTGQFMLVFGGIDAVGVTSIGLSIAAGAAF